VSNITLPRAEAEQIRDALASGEKLFAALAALDAALEAQEDEALLNEPVAMRYDGDGYGYLYIDSGSGSDWQRRHKDAEPLYLAPPKPDAKREPATHGEISEKFYNAGSDRHYRQTDYRLGWRAAERFHGITKEDK
jgi:hypothetical protein